MSQAVDFVVAPVVAELVAAGVIPWPYTGNARPGQDWFDECRRLGVDPTVMVQETISTRSQEGFQAGAYDCQFAETRARQRGHGGALAVVVSDGSSRDAWDCTAYARGWGSVATMPFFPYGAIGVTSSFLQGARGNPLSLDGEWVPETWGHGRIASQLVGADAGLSTSHDVDTVFIEFGPAPPPGPTQPTAKEHDAMIIFGQRRDSQVTEFWLAIGSVCVQQFVGPVASAPFDWIPQSAVDYSAGTMLIKPVNPGVIDDLSLIAHKGQLDPVEPPQPAAVDVDALASKVWVKLREKLNAWFKVHKD